VAVTKPQTVNTGVSFGLSQLAAACRLFLSPKPTAANAVTVAAKPPFNAKQLNSATADGFCRATKAVTTGLPQTPASKRSNTLQAFCLSALALPGMAAQAQTNSNVQVIQQPANTELILTPAETGTDTILSSADSDEEAGFQYSHYEQSKYANYVGNPAVLAPSPWNPITVDGQHGFARFRLSDRVRLAVNYSEDVWSGATTWFTGAGGKYGITNQYRGNANTPLTGASYSFDAAVPFYFDAQGHALSVAPQNPMNHSQLSVIGPERTIQALGYASPEIRDQGDFKLGYDWDNVALDVGGGVSQERDYLSRFGNLGLRLDFNQKLTTLNLGTSYTNSDTHAELDAASSNYTTILNPNLTNCTNIQGFRKECGNRQDAAFSLALSQVLSKNAVLSAGFAYTRSSGYLSNPYKAVIEYTADPVWRQEQGISASAYPGLIYALGTSVVAEQRPSLRNQFTWDASYRHYIEPLNAAGKLGYSFFLDDWGINAHTFDAEWRQSLFNSWTITPHARYYAQTTADFYTPYVLSSDPSNPNNYSLTGTMSNAPLANRYFSGDARLSAYGAVSGGVTIAKQFSRGLTMELGYEYYVHKGALALDGVGSGNSADYNYFVANAALHANIGQLAQNRGMYAGEELSAWLTSLFEDNPALADDPHAAHHHHHQHGVAGAPAGVMFAHMLDQADQFMVGYRYMRSTTGPGYQQGTQAVDNSQVLCQNKACDMLSTGMTMNMHMLEFMYAPADWLTLMLMPQFVDMSMNMSMPPMIGKGMNQGTMSVDTMRTWQSSGGFGDTSGYAMFKLWDEGDQHLHLTQGISAPTGSVNIRQEFQNPNNQLYYSYGMQLGSGTWDYKPSLTYTGKADDWFWGGQVSGSHRLQQQNSYGWRLGDVFQSTAWGGYQFTNWLSTTVRGVYTGQGRMAGQWNQYYGGNMAMTMPDNYTSNYGGSFGDVGFGLTMAIPSGRLAGNTLSFEWLQPVYTDYQGIQSTRSGALSATWGYMF